MRSTDSRLIRRRFVVGWLPALLVFAFGGTLAGCASPAPAMTAGYAPVTSAPAGPAATPSGGGAVAMGRTMGHAMPSPGEVEAMMAARPAFVQSAGTRTREAYAFAIARPDVTDWMPCYCGCVAMDHRNNTDCYLKPRMAGATATFDEHASYCGICVDITLKAKSMVGEGRTLVEIRAAIDREFGSAGPGTKTALPPS